jgi:hypothetical protein
LPFDGCGSAPRARSPRERNLQPADYAKLMQRMTREAKAAPPEMSEVQRKEVTRLFSRCRFDPAL